MPWARLDDHFYANRKIQHVSSHAFKVYVNGLVWAVAHLTDGLLDRRDLVLFAGTVPQRYRSGAVGELVAAGLWYEQASGWCINDYAAYQPTREQVLNERKANRERQTRFRQSRNAVTNAAPSQPDPTLKEYMRDELWDSIVQVHGEPANQTERGKFNKAHKLLREANVGGGEYPRLVQAFTTRYDGTQPAVMTVATRVGELRHFLKKGKVQKL